MSVRSVLLLLSFGLPVTLAAQQPLIQENFNDKTLVESGWFATPSVVRDSTNAKSGPFSIKFSGEQAILMANFQVRDPGLLEFWYRAPEGSASLTVDIEVSRDAALWQRISTGELDEQESGAGYRARIVSIDRIGSYYLRWRVSTGNGETFFIDDVKLEKITEQARERRQREQVSAQVRKELIELSNHEQTLVTFRSIGESYREEVNTILTLIRQTSGVLTISSSIQAVSIRNQMANPVKYDKFHEIVASLNNVLPETKKMRLTDLVKPFGNIVTRATNFVTGGMLGNLVENFKTLLADGFSPNNIHSVLLNKKARETAKKIGPELYKQSSEFFVSIEGDFARVDSLDQQIRLVQAEAAALKAEIEKFLKDYIQFVEIDANDGFIRDLKRGESAKLTELNEDIKQFFTRKVGSEKSFKTLSPLLVQTLIDAASNQKQIESYVSNYFDLASNMLTYYRNFAKSLDEGNNPFLIQDAASAQQWNAQRETALESIATAEREFRESFVDIVIGK